MKNLFVFAHQDDEFGVFHEIKKLSNEGQEIFIVYLTSGTLDGSMSMLRDMESMETLALIGVKRENVFFLGGLHGLPDGKLSCHIEKAFLLLCNILSDKGPFSKIYTLAWEGGHQDHDAVHLISLASAKKINILENCYQIPLYTGMNTVWIIFRLFVANQSNGKPVLSKIPIAERIQFLKYIFAYRSQVKTWIALFPFLVLHYVFYGTQVLQKTAVSRLLQKPHDGIMLYERRGFYTYIDFQTDTDPFIKKYL